VLLSSSSDEMAAAFDVVKALNHHRTALTQLTSKLKLKCEVGGVYSLHSTGFRAKPSGLVRWLASFGRCVQDQAYFLALSGIRQRPAPLR
jgi:hypothetical protein